MTSGPSLPATALQDSARWRREAAAAPVHLSWDWVFKSLWYAAESNNDSTLLRNVPVLNVPSTVLFTAGDPTHWLATDEDTGRLVRVAFPNPSAAARGDKYARRELRLRACWDGLLRFSEKMRVDGVTAFQLDNPGRAHSNSAVSQGTEKDKDVPQAVAPLATLSHAAGPPVVIAWYHDGGREKLDLESWSRLMGHRTWRVQVCALQGYVNPESKQTGNYVALQQVDPRTRALPMANPAMDSMCRKLAQYCEAACAQTGVRERNVMPSTRVIKMRAEFCVDVHGKLWFLHCSHIFGQEMAAPAPSTVQHTAAAAQIAASAEGQLRDLVCMALNRGLNIGAAFRHFDPDNQGAVSAMQFVAGVRKLGIALPPASSNLLLARIGADDDGLLTVDDFGAFIYEAFTLAFPERRFPEAATLVHSGIKRDQSVDAVHDLEIRHSTASTAEGASISSPNSDKRDSVYGPAVPSRTKAMPVSVTAVSDGRPILPHPKLGDRLSSRKNMLPDWAAPASHQALGALQSRLHDYERTQNSVLRPDRQLLNSVSQRKSDKPQTLELNLNGFSDSHTEHASALSDDATLHESELTNRPEVELQGLLGQQSGSRVHQNCSVYAVDSHTTMLYRVLDTRGRLGGFDGTTNATAGEGLAHVAVANARGMAIEAGKDDFSICVLPDFFDSIDTLQGYVNHVQVRYPRVRILLVSFPGQPGTRWSTSQKLNNEFLARCLCYLFAYMQRSQIWHWRPRRGVDPEGGAAAVLEDALRRNVLLIGSGNGANVAAYYISHYARVAADAAAAASGQKQTSSAPDPLSSILRACMLVNVFSHLDKTLTRALKRMIRLHSSAVHTERVLNMTQLLFSKKFTADHDHAELLRVFYSTRHPPKAAAEGRDARKPDVDTGALSLIRGALAHVDLRAALPRLSVPCIVVQASENALVLPAHAEVLARAIQGPKGGLAKTVGQCLSHSRMSASLHVSYLRAGHAVFQERARAMKVLVESVCQALEPGLPVASCAVRTDTTHDPQTATSPAHDIVLEGRPNGVADTGGAGQEPHGYIMKAAHRDHQPARKYDRQRQTLVVKTAGSSMSEEKERLPSKARERRCNIRAALSLETIQGMESGGMEWVKAQLDERGLESSSGNRDDLVSRLDGALRLESSRQQAAIQSLLHEQRKRQTTSEAEKRALAVRTRRQSAEEKKRIDEEVRRLRDSHRSVRFDEWLVNQRRLMVAEDELGRALRQQSTAVDIFEQSTKTARKYMKELDRSRRKAADLKAAKGESLSRAELRGKRSKRVQALSEQYESQELHLSGDDLGYGLDADFDNLSPLQNGCARLVADMNEIRRRKRGSMEKHDAAVEKRNGTEQKVCEIEAKLRDCRRAIRDTVKAIDAAKKRGRRLPNGRRITAREFKSQQEQRRQEKEALNAYRLELELEEQEFVSLRKAAREECHALAGSVQRITIVQKANEKKIDSMIHKLLGMKRSVQRRRKVVRRANIRASRSLGDLMTQHVEKDRRMALIQGERERCTLCSTGYIDSMVFNHFKQRIRVSALISFLDAEISTTEEALHSIQQRLVSLRRGQEARAREEDQLDIAGGIVEHEYETMTSTREHSHVPVADLVRRARLQVQEADVANAASEKRRAEAEAAEKAGAKSLAERTRLKPADERSTEERHFTALDLVLHPECYVGDSDENKDVYKYDSAFRTSLSRKDLQRIVVLPEALNLALPFLRSRDEISAHQLLLKFLFGRGESRLREEDADVLGSERRALNAIGHARLVDKVRLRNTRSELRARPMSSLTSEEAEWLKYDHLLHPHLFSGAADVGFEPPNLSETAAGPTSVALAPRRRGSSALMLPKLDQDQLLWLRAASEDEIRVECEAPFSKKRFPTMRGTCAQLSHICKLLAKFGWDSWDAPIFEDVGPDEASNQAAQSSFSFHLKMTGLQIGKVENKTGAQDAAAHFVANNLGLPARAVHLCGLSAGSCIFHFDVAVDNAVRADIRARIEILKDGAASGSLILGAREALKESLGEETVGSIQSLEVTEVIEIGSQEISQVTPLAHADSKDPQIADFRGSSSGRQSSRHDTGNSPTPSKRVLDRIKRREERKRKKNAAREERKRRAEREKSEKIFRETEEAKTRNQKLDPLLTPIVPWLQSVKSDIRYEDPRYQFGDPVPSTHPGGVHVHVIACNNIRAADMSFRGKGSSDPYVRVVVGENAAKAGRQVFTTKVIPSTLAPRWDPVEEFDFWREPPAKESTGLSELLIQVYDHDKVGSDDFLGEVRININDLPLDRCHSLRPPGLTLKTDANGCRQEKLSGRPGKRDAGVRGTILFRAWKTPSMQERETVRAFMSKEKERRLDARRAQRAQKMVAKLARERKLAAAEKDLVVRQAKAEARHRKEIAAEEARKEAERKAQALAIQKLDEEDRRLRASLAQNPTSVVNSLAEVPEACRRGPVLVRRRSDETPVESLSASSHNRQLKLGMRESRWHEFRVPQEMLSTEIKVSFTYKGVFTARGYILGRLAVGMYRVPGSEEAAPGSAQIDVPPVPIGYAPVDSCELNSPDKLGRLCIIHRPSAQCLPVRAGRYRIVVAAASQTSYTFSVLAQVAHSVPSIIKIRAQECQAMMKERPVLKQELYELTQSVRLSERKYRLVEGLITESEQACEELQRQIGSLNAKLKYDASKDGLTRDQAREIDTGIGRLELDFAAMVKKTMSRRQELKDITTGLDRMMELKRLREDKMARTDSFLLFQRQWLPAAAAAALGISSAVMYAQRINARFVAEEHITAKTGKRDALEAVKQTTMLTPAQKLRRRAMNMPHAGLGLLEVEESRWIAFDRVRCPEEWLLYSSGESDNERQSYDQANEGDTSPKSKAKRIDVPWTRQDLIRIYTAEPSTLPPQEAKLNKLMKKFHDRRPSSAAPDLGSEARDAAKRHPGGFNTLTLEQREFLLYDKVLHPAWYADVETREKWTGVDGVVGSGDGLQKTRGGYHKGHAALQRAVAASTAADKLTRRKTKDLVGGRSFSDVSAQNLSGKRDDHWGTVIGPGGQTVSLFMDVRSGRSSLTVSATKAQTDRAMQHQRDGHDPNEEFVFDPPANLVLQQVDLVELIKAKPEDVVEPRLKRVHQLLTKYAPPKIHSAEGSAIDRRGAQGKIQVIRYDTVPAEVDVDIDKRCRRVLEEIDLSFECTAPYMRSDVMHSVPQMFPIDVLRADLERELDRLLCEQVFERERATRIMDMNADPGDSASDSSDEDDTDEARALRRRRRAAKQMRSERLKKSVKIAGKGYAAALAGADKKHAKAATKRTKIAQEVAKIGHGACLACRVAPCVWTSPIDLQAVTARRIELDVERERLRSIPKSTVMVDSFVAGSVVEGGNPKMTRENLSIELERELASTFKLVKLHEVDRELHAAYASRDDYFETEVLHGFKQMQWTKNVIGALEEERNR